MVIMESGYCFSKLSYLLRDHKHSRSDLLYMALVHLQEHIVATRALRNDILDYFTCPPVDNTCPGKADNP